MEFRFLKILLTYVKNRASGRRRIVLVKNILKPHAKEAVLFIEKYHQSTPDKTLLLIIGKCMIDYCGRARSLLDWGERIVLIKQDGTILVHRPNMREPVNWQSPGTKINFSRKDDQLIIKSHHNRPPEKMKIVFKHLQLVLTTSLNDKAPLVISGMETDVVNQILNNPEIIEEGLRISKREKQVKTGMIDLFGYDKHHTPVVIEVKRSVASISAVQQLRMYINDIKNNVKEAPVRGILCAPRIPTMVKKLLSDYNLEWKEVERTIVIPDDQQTTLKDFKGC